MSLKGGPACEGGSLGRRESLTAAAYDDDDGQANSSAPLNCLNLGVLRISKAQRKCGYRETWLCSPGEVLPSEEGNVCVAW